MGLIKGRDIMIFVERNGKYEAIAYARSCILQISIETTETSSKASGKWSEKKAKRLSWSCSSDNLLGEGQSGKIFRKMTGLEPVKITFSFVDNPLAGFPDLGFVPTTKERYQGEAIITSLEINSDDGDLSSMNISLEGTGAIEYISDNCSENNDSFNYELPFKLG